MARTRTPAVSNLCRSMARREPPAHPVVGAFKTIAPRLDSPFDAGLCEIEGVSLLYVVMERADADLAQVLPSAPLRKSKRARCWKPVVRGA